jgi:ubiquinone/menaquinone biosynthesis C-methylase UbiE
MGQADPYARIAPWHDRFLNRVDDPVRTSALEMSAPRNTMRVLDVGCGTGTTLEQYITVSSSIRRDISAEATREYT